ncbi:uncharacterized protein LTR77_000090 [Saxophila tyrrhenica]|uniref:Uncharacterized protein n=1 Tax=Saxophila tyrrhenica TaxID=1690608 RepID=A0AAV9PPH9_9PEZI|nr:hypothetical protein LTR77_000090 [Saxophila tyrrhenica]
MANSTLPPISTSQQQPTAVSIMQARAPPMIHPSRQWVNPNIKANQEKQALNRSRRRICKNSPFWSFNFDLAQHHRDWAAGKDREARHKATAALLQLESSIAAQDGDPFPIPPPPIRRPLDGKSFTTAHSNVLSLPTVFCPQFKLGKQEEAPWPTKSEMKYEGDDRISTDRLHGRFPGAPRVPGNETVNWQHKAIIIQWPFDDFLFPLPGEVEIWMRGHVVGELEFSEKEAEVVLGGEIMGLLDPQDQFLE